MEINYELTEKDLIDFSNIIAKDHESTKINTKIFSVLAVAFIFADFIYVVVRGWEHLGGFEGFMLSLMFRFVLSIAVIYFFYLFAIFMQKRLAKKLKNTEKNGVFCEHKLVFDENVLAEVTDVNTAKHSWISVGEIKEIDDFVSINVNLHGNYIIPKRYFNDEQHIKEFVENAQHYQQSAKDKFNSSHLAAFERDSNLLSENNRD